MTGTNRSTPTAKAIARESLRVGRNAYPTLVRELYEEGLLTVDVAARVVPAAWSAAEFPGRHMSQDKWRRLFDHAGYTVDGEPADRPSGSLTLWRGATPEARSGWSWTSDPSVARWFANRPINFGDGRLWVARVQPDRLLARITVGRHESEYVVDTRGLRIQELAPVGARPAGTRGLSSDVPQRTGPHDPA